MNWWEGANWWWMRISWSLRSYQRDRAQPVEILCLSDRTYLRGDCHPWRPTSASITATLHFGDGLRHLVRTAPVCQACITISWADIYASGAIRRGVKSRGAFAKETADGVCTFSPFTDSRNGAAFINIFTFL